MLQVYSSDRAVAGMILAHGAGGGQQSQFMVLAARELAARGIVTATFDFPYMAQGRSVPDKAPVLEAEWRRAIEAARQHPSFARLRQGSGGQTPLPLVIGGKSMGGRIASHVGAQHVEGITGLVYLGYPLHPPGRPEQRRDCHLPDIREPMLFVQGTRDQFGTAAEIRELLPSLNPRAQLFEVADGDHSFKVRVKTVGRKQDAVHAEIFDTVTRFIQACASSPSR